MESGIWNLLKWNLDKCSYKSGYFRIFFVNSAVNYPQAALKPGRIILVNLSPGHPGPIRFTNYPGLTRIGSREKEIVVGNFSNTLTYFLCIVEDKEAI